MAFFRFLLSDCSEAVAFSSESEEGRLSKFVAHYQEVAWLYDFRIISPFLASNTRDFGAQECFSLRNYKHAYPYFRPEDFSPIH